MAILNRAVDPEETLAVPLACSFETSHYVVWVGFTKAKSACYARANSKIATGRSSGLTYFHAWVFRRICQG